MMGAITGPTERSPRGAGQKRALIIYLIGLVFGLLVAIGAIWPDLEASLFDPALRFEEQLALRCHVFLTAADGLGEVRVTIANPSDERPARIPVRTRVSDGYVTLMREVNATLQLEPGGRDTLAYDISPSDAAYGRIILVRVLAFRSSPFRGGQATCGVLWLDTPLIPGGLLLALLLLVSLSGMGYGSYVVWRNGRLSPRAAELSRFMLGVAGLVLIAMLAGLLGWWLIGTIALALMVLIAGMFGIIIEYFSRRRVR